MAAVSEDTKAIYYAGLVPIIGTRLQNRQVAVVGLGAVALAAERLADCGVLRWQLCDAPSTAPHHPLGRLWGRRLTSVDPAQVFTQALRRRLPWEEDWQFQEYPSLTEQSYATLRTQFSKDRPDLILGGGTVATLRLIGRLARDLDLPAVLVALNASAAPRSAVLVLLPGDRGQGRDVDDLLRFLGNPDLLNPSPTYLAPDQWFNWQEANASAAALARALLLQGSSYAPPDLTRLLRVEHRTALIQGTPDWPWQVDYLDLAQAAGYQIPDSPVSTPRGPQVASGPVLVIGCGSLGSHAARSLVAAEAARELVLIDAATVEPGDLCCQFYAGEQVGRNRAEALAQQLAQLVPSAHPSPEWVISVDDENRGGLRRACGDWCFIQLACFARPGAWFDKLVTRLRPAVVILTIDSPGDEDLARVLREWNVPHIVARCDAHAAYFEVVVVDGSRGPCLDCMRDAIFPTPARLAATVVETGRAADLVARLAWQLSLPPAARAAWFTRLLNEERTALIGGNGSIGALPTLTPPAIPAAYGVNLPGQVVARAPDPASYPCPECGHLAPVRAAS